MRFDNIIIGGGLSGLTCGIKLAEQGRQCAIVSSGQSATHFFSGSFNLLGKVNGKEVEEPLQAMQYLPDTHPYRRIGLENVSNLTNEAKLLLTRAELKLNGDSNRNHYVLTPMGIMKPTWLSLDDFSTFKNKDSFPWKKVIILNFTGFLDFHTLFIQDSLRKLNIEAPIQNVSMKQFDAIRKNPSEMRSTNIAKVFDNGEALNEFAKKVNELNKDYDVVILPAVFGLLNNWVAEQLKLRINTDLMLLPALPPSVPGIRSQILLRKRFEALGGTFFLGDHVEEGKIVNKQLQCIKTYNHGNIELQAEQFIMASGSFYSKGLVASPDRIYEPIFGLEVNADQDREKWFDEEIFNDQAFMHYGVKTDERFRAIKNGEPIENLFVAGSVLGGANTLKEGSGAGISLLSSLHAANQIL